MSISDANLVTGTSSAASTTTLTMSATVAVGRVLVVCVGADNIGTTDADFSEVSVSDAVGNAYRKAAQYTNGQAGAGAGATVAIFWARITTALVAQDVTATFNSAIISKCMGGVHFGVATGAHLVLAGSATPVATDGGNTQSVSISGLTSGEYLFVRADAIEAGTAAGTETASWTELVDVRNSGNLMQVYGEFQIATATGATSLPSSLTNALDRVAVMVALKESTATPRMVLPIGRPF